MKIDLNCDLGEGMSNDAAIMPYISSANIACGYHAGNESTIKKTIELCLHHKVAVGAHPGFADKKNFGRTPMSLSPDELVQIVTEQLEIIQTICKTMGAKLKHVKPHGALYNMAAKDKEMSATIAQAILKFNPALTYYGLSGSCMIDEAKKIGLSAAHEVFADRTYQPDGLLTPRSAKNALIDSPETSLLQVLRMLENKNVIATNGSHVPIVADTVCIHGDGPHASAIARYVYDGLKAKGFAIRAVGD